MSAFLGKRNYKAVLQKFIAQGHFDEALKEAVEEGDYFYDKNDPKSALQVYLDLLKMCENINTLPSSFHGKVYDKTIPLFFELDDTKNGIHYTFLLVDEKLKHNEKEEAVNLISILQSKFPGRMEIALKAVNVHVAAGQLENAFNIVNKFIETKGATPALIELAGVLLFNLKKYEDAENYFNVLLKLKPDNEVALKRLSEILELKDSETSSAEKGIKVEVEPAKEFAVKEGILPVQPSVDTSGKKPPLTPLEEELELKKTAAPGEKQEKIPAAKEPSTVKVQAPGAGMTEFTFSNDPEYIKGLKCMNRGAEEEAKKLLVNVAERYAKVNFIEAEHIYNKVLLIDPGNVEIIRRLSHLSEESGKKEDAVFYLRIACKYAKGEEKFDILYKITNLLPQDKQLKKDFYDMLVNLDKKDEAVSMFLRIADTEPNVSSLSEPLFHLIKEDVEYLRTVSKYLRNKSLSDKTTFQYFYTLGKILCSTNEVAEGIRWLISAHRIDKLSLEDYLELANYIADIPDAVEKNIVAKALYSCMDDIVDLSKKEQIIELLLKLDPSNKLFLLKKIYLLERKGDTKKLVEVFLEFVDLNPVANVDFVCDEAKKLAEELTVKELIKIAQFFEIADRSDKAVEIYELILKREPDSKEAALNMFIVHLENEEADNIVDFFDKFTPSHLFFSSLEKVIKKYEEKRTKDSLNYNVHYVLGFLCFIVERYEEAIAAFQFVIRSEHYIPLMCLFLGMSFEKIGLFDFATKQYEKGLSLKDLTDNAKAHLLYRSALRKKFDGSIDECKNLLEEALKIAPDFKLAEEALSSAAGDGKVIQMEGGDKA